VGRLAGLRRRLRDRAGVGGARGREDDRAREVVVRRGSGACAARDGQQDRDDGERTEQQPLPPPASGHSATPRPRMVVLPDRALLFVGAISSNGVA
jgi:hypothetical protein